MSRRIFVFDPPDRFAAGAVGQPGQRTFYLQATKGRQAISVALEKVQVAVLAERLVALVAAIRQSGMDADTGTAEGGVGAGAFAGIFGGAFGGAFGSGFAAGSSPSGEVSDEERVDPLVEPVFELFRVGTLALAWDTGRQVMMVEARAARDDEDDDDEEERDEPDEVADDDPDGPDVLRVLISPAMALDFARNAVRLVAAGRPPCPMCGQPLNPEGHLCPRRNGYVH